MNDKFKSLFNCFFTRIRIYKSSKCFVIAFRMPDRVLKPSDFPANKNWKPYIGMSRNSGSPHTLSQGGQRMLR